MKRLVRTDEWMLVNPVQPVGDGASRIPRGAPFAVFGERPGQSRNIG